MADVSSKACTNTLSYWTVKSGFLWREVQASFHCNIYLTVASKVWRYGKLKQVMESYGKLRKGRAHPLLQAKSCYEWSQKTGDCQPFFLSSVSDLLYSSHIGSTLNINTIKGIVH